MKNIALIFAGGTGQRMGSETPKQFLKICGREIIVHTLELFEQNENIDEIYVACIQEWIPYLEELIKKYDIDKVVKVFPGGKTGQDSIFLALSEAKKENENAVVLVHDGVRPLVSQETINKVVESVKNTGTGITVTEAYETPIMSEDGMTVGSMPPRKKMYTAQAPQGFMLNDIYEKHLEKRKTNPDYEGIVDSCGLMFKYGVKCNLVLGNRGNIKVTTPEDFYTLLSALNMRDYEQISILSENKVKKLGERNGI